MMRIENWSITWWAERYTAPECAKFQLQGDVIGNPKFEDGKYIRTSDIMEIDGSRVTTRSGSVYILGEPKREYVEWCRENCCHVPTPEEPIKV
jgi:hypothetical protein